MFRLWGRRMVSLNSERFEMGCGFSWLSGVGLGGYRFVNEGYSVHGI